MRRLLGPGWVTLGTAASVVAVVVGTGFLVQRTALRSPSPATIAAVRAGVWLERYRLVDSTITLDGGRVVHGRCLQDWVVAAGRRRRGAILRLDDGYVLLAAPPHTLSATGGSAETQATSPLVLMELAGCPRVLARRVQTLAQERRGLTYAHDRLGFTLKGTHVTLELAPHTGAPVGVELVAATERGVSRIRFAPLTTGLRSQLLLK
jgi:hypothetical protein